jgi:acetyl-CoA acyltransferase
MCGFANAIVAGGTESMSLVPMGGNKVSPNPTLVDTYPDVYLSTGLVAENHARDHGITREEQDAFALRSHQRAIAAIDAGKFKDEITALTFRVAVPAPALAVAGVHGGAAASGHAQEEVEIVEMTHAEDEGPRRATSMDALAKLRPAFHANGTVTAGNSSQTSDGAAAVIVTSADFAREHGLQPLGRFVAYAIAGVAPERFGIGPVPAIQKVLKLTGLSLDQIELVELNEAFAAQALACLRELPIDPDKLNVNGGAIALGHPLGCTGAKLTTTLLYEMRRRQARYGLVTMCVGGGMGAAGIFERL